MSIRGAWKNSFLSCEGVYRKILFSERRTMSCTEDEAALFAALVGDEAAVRSWLERGGRANIKREDGEVTGVTLLMDTAGQGSNGATALMLAAGNGHERVVELLIQRGAEVNLQNSEGATALMGAAYYGYARVVDMLLQRGVEINLQDSKGCTTLMGAAGSAPAGGRVADSARR